MRIGVPREVKNNENRVGLGAASVHALVAHGHEVLVETGAGLGSRVTDEDYLAVGATIVPTADEVWARADMIVKVKEPLPEEYGRLRKGLILFTYLHLAADRELTEALLASGTTAIAYETVQLADRSLPLLAPMSAIAGRLAAQVAAYHLMAPLGGAGVPMGGVPGTSEADVLGAGRCLPPRGAGGRGGGADGGRAGHGGGDRAGPRRRRGGRAGGDDGARPARERHRHGRERGEARADRHHAPRRDPHPLLDPPRRRAAGRAGGRGGRLGAHPGQARPEARHR